MYICTYVYFVFVVSHCKAVLNCLKALVSIVVGFLLNTLQNDVEFFKVHKFTYIYLLFTIPV